MKRIITLFIVLTPMLALGQWNINGTHIYNSNTGNVGIGTTSPDYKLHIKDGNGGAQLKFQRGTGISTIAQDYNVNNLYIDAPAGLMLNNFGGNVGIGTASPSNRLHVWGTVGDSNTGVVRLDGGGANASLRIGLNTDYAWIQSHNSRPLHINELGNSTILNSQAGNVGIGTTSPNSKLEITDGPGGEQLRISRGGGTVRFVQEMGLDNLYLYNKDASKLYMFWKQDGNVGIGTNTPDAKLEVYGKSSTGMRLNGTSGDLEALSVFNTTATNLPSGNGAVIQFYNNANNYNNLAGASIKSVSSNNQYGWESDLHLRTTKNNSFSTQTILEAMVIKGGSGNVGIGTTNPNQKLTVNGTIYGKEVKVDLNVPGPDYVFEENYALPSLTETEAYIKANKHLPEVPSAKEMEANGINLSEMNMLLLKKVEELTLHLIELKKENIQMKEENKKQNEVIQSLLNK
jgi:hypothetical protein